MIQLVFVYISLSYVIIFNPFTDRSLLFEEIRMEIHCAFFLIGMFCFTEMMPDPETRYEIGWVFVGVFVFYILISLILLVQTLFIDFKNYIKGKYSKLQDKLQHNGKQDFKEICEKPVKSSLKKLNTISEVDEDVDA